MKKFLLLFLYFSLCNGFAQSNEFKWNKIASTKDNSSDYYLDSNSTRAIGNYRYQWILNNKLKNSDEVKSNVDYATIDCKRNKLQIILISDHSKHFGKGKIENHALVSEGQLEWMTPKPKTIMSTIIEKSCKNMVSSISSDDSESDLDANSNKKNKSKKRKYKEF
tara:strand:+ start:218 stop:712 length:495 start_codon:yes stop_codon:yes gene_type:complete